MGHIEDIQQDIAQQEQKGKSLLDDFQVDLSLIYPEPSYTLFQNGNGTMPRGDIIAIKAKSKNGKTYLALVLAASVFGVTEFGFDSADSSVTVIYFDTEQNERNTARLAKRVHTLLGWDEGCNHPQFLVFALRKADTSKRKQVINDMISKHKPAVVFVDGIADLIDDFNDVGQSTQIINDLMKLSADNDCAICCILHENKRAEDKGMKGHLGTMLLQKSSDVYEIERDGVQFNVTETDCRNLPIDGFSFRIDENGLPRHASTKADIKRANDIEEIQKVLIEVFKDSDGLSYNDLVSAYKLHSCQSDATAKRKLKTAKQSDLIDVIPETKKYRPKGTWYQHHPSL